MAARGVIEASYPGEALLADSDETRGLERYWLLGADQPRAYSAFPEFGPALVYVAEGEAMACAVQVPSLDETFSAVRDGGATLEGLPIRVAPSRHLDEAILLSIHLDIPIPAIGHVVRRLAGWRMPSPQAGLLPLFCYLASGRIDGFLAFGGSRAELLAGRLLVEEAGGFVESAEELEPRNGLFAAAATRQLLTQMLARLKVRRA
jgi:myo-inositol-1(or 4)-monophosphatase